MNKMFAGNRQDIPPHDTAGAFTEKIAYIRTCYTLTSVPIPRIFVTGFGIRLV